MVERLYPIDLLRCGKADWRPSGGSIEGLRSLAGDTPDRLSTGRGGLWICSMSDIMLETVEEKRTWRALRSQMRNGSLPIIVPVERMEWLAQPLRYPSPDGVPYSDGAMHSDGAGFADAPIEARFTAAAALGDIEVSIRVLGAEPFQSAEVFTVVTDRAGVRLYEVAGVIDATPVTGGFDYVLEINPPLRDDVAVDGPVDFNDPRCEMRLMDPDGMAFDEDIVTFVDVTFVEDHRALAEPPA
ncbi:hypothetical protein [Methylopila sp. M107]|uniref:hypothetical protein n=1 Tax=Methylopila sp. M107 TaxID=1101190 RepID=UPI000377D6CE|nr:hypothetical protein [Methylopila sp. M107]